MKSEQVDKELAKEATRLTKEEERRRLWFAKERALEEAQREAEAKRREKRIAEEAEQQAREQERRKAWLAQEQALERTREARKADS
jgi:hypothetical protein